MSDTTYKQAQALVRAIQQLPASQQQSFVHMQALALAERLQSETWRPQGGLSPVVPRIQTYPVREPLRVGRGLWWKKDDPTVSAG